MIVSYLPLKDIIKSLSRVNKKMYYVAGDKKVLKNFEGEYM